METEIFNEEMYRKKKIFFENRKKEEEKYLTRKEDKSQFLKHLNLEVYPEKYKFKELVSTAIKDKYYLLEQEYKQKGIPYSPYLIHPPGSEDQSKSSEKKDGEDFDYYKRHILLESYDEEPEEPGVILQRMEELKKNNGKIGAKTRWFDNVGNQGWKECEVLNYDEKKNMFNIKIYNNGNMILKSVTRFNCLLDNEKEENIQKRMNLANNWKFYAQKYIALDHFILESSVPNPYNFITKNYMRKLLWLTYYYTGKNKHQCNPIEFENMDNNQRFGIWRRFSFPREIDINKNKLDFIIQNLPPKIIEDFMNELKTLNERSYHIETFYKNLPMNFHYYKLLKDIVPVRKFLTPSEQFLIKERDKGLIKIKRKFNFLDVFTKMEFKLHQNEEDFSQILLGLKAYEEKTSNHLFFYQNFFNKPVKLKFFFEKNKATEAELIKEITNIIGQSNYLLSQALNKRKETNEIVDINAGIPEHIKHKSKKFENLMNKMTSHIIRNTFHKSMKYIIGVFTDINKKIKSEYNLDFEKFAEEYFEYHKVDMEIKAKKDKIYKRLLEKEKQEEEKRNKEMQEKEKKGEKVKKHENIKDKIKKEGILDLTEEEKKILNDLQSKIPEFKIDEIFQIRDNYPLEYIFQTDFNLMQFEFELKSNNKHFYLEPNFDSFWSTLEDHIRQSLNHLSSFNTIVVLDRLSHEEQQNQYLSESKKYLQIFFEDDNSVEEELDQLKNAVKLYFTPVEIFLRILNTDVMSHLNELMKFANMKKQDEEKLNITNFRYFINENNKYIEFFENEFKYDYFFLGGFSLSCKSMKESWLKTLNVTREKLFNLVKKNNEYITTKIENERKEVEKKLDEDPKNVDEYNENVKYNAAFPEKIKVIWENINQQQANANLLEDNLHHIEDKDFFRVWSCYGVPRILQIKKEEKDAKLEADRKKFKKQVKQRYRDALIAISNIKAEFENYIDERTIDSYEKIFNAFCNQKFVIEEMIATCRILNEHESILRMKTSDLTEIREIKAGFDPYFELWDSVSKFLTGRKNWMEKNLNQIDRKKLKETYEKCIYTLDNLERTIFRKDKPNPHNVIILIKKEIEKFQPILPVLYDLINPDFKANHIGDLGHAIGIPIPENLEINLLTLIEMGILDKREEIAERSIYATGQKKLNATLDKLKEKYKQMKFDLISFNESEVFILKDIEPLCEEIDNILTKIVSLSSSKFAKFLQKDIHYIWSNIAKAQDIIDAWLKTQKLLTQLQQIFAFGDLKKQLSEEYPKYLGVENQWKNLMEQIKGSPQLSEVVQMIKIKENFINWGRILEEVNQSLNAFLNTKRDAFPRFYFVSNEELTLMLAQCSEPAIIATKYIQQVFEGMKYLTYSTKDFYFNVPNYETNEVFKKEYHLRTIESFVSEQGEKVLFNTPINPHQEIKQREETIYVTEALEKWLGDVEFQMKLTLKKIFKECYFSLNPHLMKYFNELEEKDKKIIDIPKIKNKNKIKRVDWAMSHIEQAVLTISQLDWTQRTEEAINKVKENPDSLKQLHEKDKNTLLELIVAIRSSSNNFTKTFKKTLVSLIIQDVHANDVIDYLYKNGVNSSSDFDWISQLRYIFVNQKGREIEHIKDISSINVKMLNTERAYDFEYLGNQKRLVITPLTDRCYRTMMEALSNNLGGAPEGPAGTGKTETIKDLSKNLGKKCFTYNCSEDSDFILMTKFFKGISMSGCWVCFDEFNRITLDVLSVIAHQISILLNCLKARATFCNFDGHQFNFNYNMGIFITMNPNYAGRSELPDNLKGLFRPLAMMIPNYEMITEIMLYSYGFKKARDLSKKIVSSLRLASEQLSSQYHYDYGMRALNGIINYIGVITSEHMIENEEQESDLVQKAILDSNMPKFIADDYKIYTGILSDLFPNSNFVNKIDEKLLTSLENKSKELNLRPNKFLIDKVVDFINILSVRHAVMIVGAPMSNKSSIMKVYLNGLPDFFKSTGKNNTIKAQFINPKAITSPQLFGFVNKKTMEFTEGICSKALRGYFEDTSDDLKLLVFDGPVDTLWIENMNSVLDDTKKLCLENSDQIRLDEKTFIIFEIDDLSQASLATISRCGVVYTDRVNIDPSDFFYSWLNTLPNSYTKTNYPELITCLFEKYYKEIVDGVLFDEYNNLKKKIGLPLFKNWFMKTFVNILECNIFNTMSKEDTITDDIEKQHLKELNEGDNAIGTNTNNSHEKKIIMNQDGIRTISESERENLYNKFIYSILVCFTWILENPKDQVEIVEKLKSINAKCIKDPNFQMAEEALQFNRSYESNYSQLLNTIYNFEEKSFINVNQILKENHEVATKKIQEDLLNGNDMMIPSMQTYRAKEILKLAQINKMPLLMYGSTASGKSLSMMNFILNMNNEELALLNEQNKQDEKSSNNKNNANVNQNSNNSKHWLNYTFIFNSKTTANNICDLIEEKINFKLKKGSLAPQGNKNALILIEDLNMPTKERYGAQPPIEILRQFFDYGGWYDRKEQDFINFNNILINSCLTLGRPIVSLRLLWHFIPFSFSEIDDITMKDIFKEYYEALFRLYPNQVRKLKETIVEGAINSFKRVKEIFRPLPITPQYNFNLRDLVKIFSSIAMVKSEVLSKVQNSTDYMLSTLLHETCRVYQDRLSSEEDQIKFKNSVLKELQNFIYHGVEDIDAEKQYNSLLFSQINEDELYIQVNDIDELKQNIYDQISVYNANRRAKERLDLILFDYSMKHLLRIDRVLSRSGEHSVLVGLTGSGRKSLINICAFIKKFKIFLTRGKDEVENYSHKDWLKDIQELYRQTGIRLENSIFLLNDNNINDDQMYVDLNCIISSGIVYNLFTGEEKAEVIGNARQMKEYEELNNIDDNLFWDYIMKKVREKCRVFICMNPLNKNFAKILRQFPALINTYMDFYEKWPEDALFFLAQRELCKDEYLNNYNFSNTNTLVEKNITSSNNNNENTNNENNDSKEELGSRMRKNTKKLSMRGGTSSLSHPEKESMVDKLSHIFAKVFTEINKQSDKYFIQTRKKVIILPKSFLDFIEFFLTFKEKHSHKLEDDIKKYKWGVKCIEEAGEQIKLMSELLEKQKPKLLEQQKEIDKTLAEITTQSAEAKEAEAECSLNEKIAIEKQKEAEEKKTKAEEMQKEAEIIKEEIKQKINKIDKKQFMALRSYRQPPKEIVTMMRAISIIMSNFEKKPLETVPTQWDYYKKKLNDVSLLKTLQSLPKKLESTQFSPKIVELLTPYISDRDIEPSYMEKKISSTCACFCHFIINMYKLDILLKEKLIPLAKESAEATASFNEAQENLAKIQASVRAIKNKLEELNDRYQDINKKQQKLQMQISESQKKLNRAQKLTSKLGGEKKRWADSAVELSEKLPFVFGDVLLSSLYIAFLGPFIVPFREEFVKNVIFKLLEEKKIQFSHIAEINKLIGDPFDISNWVINGLPPDSGSLDSGIILFEATKPCLLIDPQKQAVKFFQKLYKNDFTFYKKIEINVKKILKPNEKRETLMENCISNGKVLIFDYISYDIPPDAELLLNSEIVKHSDGLFLKLNENYEIKYEPTFKYYLISYLVSPVFNPDLYGRISIINFTVNKEGLNEQLLSVIVKEESPADESEKNNILQKKFQLNETIHKTEQDILSKLGVSSEQLLENDGLIFSLEESKKLSDEATIQITNAKKTEERIDHNRMLYMPLAKLARLIFFAISELDNLEEIYQFSISWFIKDILINSLQSIDPEGEKYTGPKTQEIVLARIKILEKSLLKVAYTAVCRSLLNKDRLVFSLLLLIRKLVEEDIIKQEDVEFFLTNANSMVDSNNEFKNKKPKFIENNLWDVIITSKRNDMICNLPDKILKDEKKWEEYLTLINSNESSNEENKGNYSEHFNIPDCEELNMFYKLMILKLINQEKLVPYVRLVITDYLGEALSQPVLFSIPELYELSNFNTPLMLIITPGLDPTAEVKKLAEDNKHDIVSVSLGQGQSKKALASIEECQKKGQWVFLQNLHLVPSFMKELEQVISNLQNNEREMNINFRLWLSSLIADNILPSILVNSIKMTVESPEGVKSNLINLLKSQQKQWSYDYTSMKQKGKEYVFEKLFIGLMHFHSILLERKNFGPIGWNIQYNFNEADFLIAKNILKSNLEKKSNINVPFKAITYLTSDCIYGGRVTDDWDRRTLTAILSDIYSPKMIDDDNFKINDLKEYPINYFEDYDPYEQHFLSLPENESPEILGLHKNTLLRKQIDEGNMLIFSLDILQKGSANITLQYKLKNLEQIKSLAEEKLIKEFNVDDIKKKYPLKYEDCMNSVLIQEIMRYNLLLELIFKNLDECVKAFMGHMPLTDEIEEMASQLIKGQIPSSWIKASYPSKKPILSWIKDLSNRINFFKNWIDNGTPLKFWFSAFFFTQSFLTGIKQNYARKNKESIDRLEFEFDFDDQGNYDMEKVKRREVYYIYGVYIEGAEWNKETHTIDELKGKNITCEMPPIILKVKVFDENMKTGYGKYNYECPVYKCSSRQGSLSTTGHSTNYIFTAYLPSNKNPNHWIKRGVALLNQLDD